jgi:glutathione S-transferase
MIELLQFRHSPYNEKVRWALDLKGVPHERLSLLPGPHMMKVKALTGRTGTPVLVTSEGPIDGSSAIVQWLEVRWPQPALLPADKAERDEALAIERRFDDDLTPRMRRVVLETLLASPSYFAAIFGDGRPRWQQIAYACTVPLAAPLVRRGNGIAGAASLEDGHRAAAEALTFVAERSAASGFLIGRALSIADISAAAALAPIVRPPSSPMRAPQPVHAATAALVERYAAHPGSAWVRKIYAAHRGVAADFDGPATARLAPA